MARLIDADKLYLGIVEKGQASKRYKIGERWELNGEEIREVIDTQPTMILEPKTGQWMSKSSSLQRPICSECGNPCIGLHAFDYNVTPYCPNCGAKMEG